MEIEKKSYKNVFMKSLRSILRAIPLIIGVVLMMGIFKVYLPVRLLRNFFTGNLLKDTFTGALVGSIAAGHSMTSYIIGGELLKDGVSMIAILSFIIAWDTIGIAQIPIELTYLGKRFTASRNIFCFFLSIFIAIMVYFILRII